MFVSSRTVGSGQHRHRVRSETRLIRSTLPLIALTLVLASVPRVGVAQAIQGVVPGDRVRFVAPEVAGQVQIEGVLHRLDQTSIVVRPHVGQPVTTNDGTVQLSHHALTSLEVAVRRGSAGERAFAGAMVGMLAGAGATGLYCWVSDDGYCGALSLLLVPAGIGIGAVYGASTVPMGWVPVDLPRAGGPMRGVSGGLSRGPTGGVALGVRVRF